MKHFLRLALLAAALLFGQGQSASAACVAGNCYLIATGNWGTAGTWSATDGGVTCVCTPTTGDNIFFTAASGSAVATMEAAYSVANLDSTGFTGTWTQNAFTLTVTGTTFKLVAGMTYTPSAITRIVAFTSTSGTTAITTAGKTLGSLTVNGAGGTFQLQDSLTIRSDGTLTITSGTFDGNSQAVTAGFVNSTGAGITRVISPGTATWTINGTSATPWDLASAAGNLTLNASNLTLVFSASATSSRIVALGTSKSYGTVTLVNSGSNPYTIDLAAGTAVTIATLNITAPIIVRLTASVTYTITNAVTWAGTAFNNPIQILAGSAITPTLALGAASTCAWCVIGGIAFSTSTLTATNSIDMKGNSGTVSISGPGGSGGRIIGG